MDGNEEGPSWLAAILLIFLGIGVCVLSGYLVYKADPKGVSETIVEMQKAVGMSPAPPSEEEEGEEP
ncbi:MAG: hypothetical protein VKN33_10170 [Candidatus Sericytochromatia bacterium]|nr:hypothetical protein [Candidatus Sericytochromatia bacterium]